MLIVDQGCATNAKRAIAFVSSRPEWFIGDKTVLFRTFEDAPNPWTREFFAQMHAFQAAVLNGRFRTYGELRPDGTVRALLVTEFKEVFDQDHKDFWRKLEAVRGETLAHLWIMDSGYLVDCSYQGIDEDGFFYGEKRNEDYGKPYKQVELSWRIEAMTVEMVKSLEQELREKTQEIWDLAGVSVR